MGIPRTVKWSKPNAHFIGKKLDIMYNLFLSL